MKNLLVKDWMTTDVITITPETTLTDAAALMRDKNIRRLPIVTADGKLVGILSQTDVMAAKPSDATTLDIWEINYLLSRLKVEKVMTPRPFTVQPDSTLKDAAQLMYDHKIGGIPVVDDRNVVVGIITESDIFRVLIAWFNEETEG
jgi:acetoin utilization protein AcuB